ncbi:MAG: hypothetical protein ACMZI0_08300 [Symbiopectobacterium sp.]|uniref:hypothetical protein n=1 Tax=Symbiopectobacterium sp. TaxID=2952789 RepID=UPI0039E9438B
MIMVEENKMRRCLLLGELYRERKARPRGEGLFIADLAQRFGAGLDFDVHYLIEKGLITGSMGDLTLTAIGVDALEGGGI